MRRNLSRLRFIQMAGAVIAGLVVRGHAHAMAPRRARHYTTWRMLGQSMFPTLRNDQVVKVNRGAYRHAAPRRGDIVLFRATASGMPPQWRMIKRVIGLPGEKVAVYGGHVYVNGHRLSEPYVKTPAMYTYPDRRIPLGSYFILGDNRNNSEDSHLFGTVSRDEIMGKVIEHR